MKRAEWNEANHAYDNACKAHDVACDAYSAAAAILRDISKPVDREAWAAAVVAKKEADRVFNEAYNIASELPAEDELEDFNADDQLTFLRI